MGKEYKEPTVKKVRKEIKTDTKKLREEIQADTKKLRKSF